MAYNTHLVKYVILKVIFPAITTVVFTTCGFCVGYGIRNNATILGFTITRIHTKLHQLLISSYFSVFVRRDRCCKKQ